MPPPRYRRNKLASWEIDSVKWAIRHKADFGYVHTIWSHEMTSLSPSFHLDTHQLRSGTGLVGVKPKFEQVIQHTFTVLCRFTTKSSYSI